MTLRHVIFLCFAFVCFVAGALPSFQQYQGRLTSAGLAFFIASLLL